MVLGSFGGMVRHLLETNGKLFCVAPTWLAGLSMVALIAVGRHPFSPLDAARQSDRP